MYGKQDWKTRERGLENCYLMTNGLGGFSSMTMTGAVSRNDHALLMACTTAPNCRYNMIHRLKEELLTETGDVLTLSTQEFEEQTPEDGYLHLAAFSYEDTPIWRFLVNGVEIKKEIGMPQEENTVALHYEIKNRSSRNVEFVLTPFFQFVPKGADLLPDQEIVFTKGAVESEGMTLHLRTNGMIKEIAETEEVYFYRYDVCDGRRAYGHARANHQIRLQAEAGKQVVLEVVYEMEPSKNSAQTIIEQTKADRKQLEETAGFTSEAGKMLSKSARQFVSKRESTGGDTILAGYPFFEDWGRDTMIALPGICISTGQFETAKRILRTFAQNERDGLMPNLFPEGGNEPLYNTVDAALLFINCVYLYYEATKDMEFVREVYPGSVSGDGADHGWISERDKVWDPHGYRRADLCRGRSCSGDLDGRTCGRDSADSKTRKAGGDQCLLVQCLKNYGNIYRRNRNKQILRATGRKGKGFVYRKILDVAEKLSERPGFRNRGRYPDPLQSDLGTLHAVYDAGAGKRAEDSGNCF